MGLLNNASWTVANELNRQSGQEDVIVWDSHLALQLRFADICSQHSYTLERMDGTTEIWRCLDPTHSGRIMFEHYAQMLVNYLCDAKEL